MYKTNKEWENLGCFVKLGQSSYVKNDDGEPLFYINQVQEIIDSDERFLMELEAECTNPNG